MVTVTLPVPESYLKNPNFQKLLRLYYVSDEGVVTKIPYEIMEESVVFQTDHFSSYVLLLEKEAEEIVSSVPSASSNPIVDHNANSSKPTSIPATGGSFYPWMFVLFFVSGAFAFCLIAFKKKKEE